MFAGISRAEFYENIYVTNIYQIDSVRRLQSFMNDEKGMDYYKYVNKIQENHILAYKTVKCALGIFISI